MNRDPAIVRAEGRLADRALALAAVALVLLTPPIIGIFDVPTLVFGVPLLHVYSYAVWLVAIACGAWLATRLGAGQGEIGGGPGPAERD